MRVSWLATSTGEVLKYSQGLVRAFPSVKLDYVTFDSPEADEGLIYQRVKDYKPDLVVTIGAPPGHKQPSPHIFAQMNFNIAPSVLLISDSADVPWWAAIRNFQDCSAFSLMVTIDGSTLWPGSASGLTLLTPVDPLWFRAQNSHAHRKMGAAYAGNPGSEGSLRRSIISDLAILGAIKCRLRDASPESYQGYCDFLMDARISVNVSFTGTGAAQHVKGRVVESGLAGCLLLEPAGSPTAEWFKPGEDYLEYRTGQEALEIIKAYEGKPEETQAFGERLRAKVLADHTPERFWQRIFDRVEVRAVSPFAAPHQKRHPAS